MEDSVPYQNVDAGLASWKCMFTRGKGVWPPSLELWVGTASGAWSGQLRAGQEATSCPDPDPLSPSASFPAAHSQCLIEECGQLSI